MMIVAYDGTDFCGYQLQQGTGSARTVAGELLRMLCIFFQVDAASLSLNVRSLKASSPGASSRPAVILNGMQ